MVTREREARASNLRVNSYSYRAFDAYDAREIAIATRVQEVDTPMNHVTNVRHIALEDVHWLLLASEGVPSFNDTSQPPVSRARAHTIKKHVDVDDASGGVSGFRDYTEACHACWTVLTSAWGQFALVTICERGPGTRVVLESEMLQSTVQVRTAGVLKEEQFTKARTIAEAAPKNFGDVVKIQTFFPVPEYKHGRPWCRFFAPGGKSGSLLFDPRLL